MASRLIEAARRRLGRSEPVARAAPDAAMQGIPDADREVVERALPYTMTGIDRLHGLVIAVRHLVRAGVAGDFAECGVWRGGSVLAMILTLQQEGVADRDVHLFDTFEGMTEPDERDTSPIDRPALEDWRESGGRPYEEVFSPEVFDEDSVRALVLSTGYPADRVHVVRGPVEETIPATAPERLALLRLDTDWYESTRHELEHLYPRLCPGGVLIVDDYGHWEGARQAVDEYFDGTAEPILLSRLDYTARLGVKR